SPEEEKKRYLLHKNSLSQEGYIRFLSQLWEPAKKHLSTTMRGLDYGCGPTPVLCSLVQQDGFQIDGYDPYFHPSSPSPPYDFILSTETVEHFKRPLASWKHIQSLLKPSGKLFVLTDPLDNLKDFPQWYYHKDPTHVSFYQPQTFFWIAKTFQWQVTFLSRRVIYFKG
ncbi:MAG: class I SAM-dependent methyltransferase, partial [Bdellovibrio sp.]